MNNPVKLLNSEKTFSLDSTKIANLAFAKIVPAVSKALGATSFQVPVLLRLESEPITSAFLLPVDPVISISGRNAITKRYPLKNKKRGSIKELWSVDDYNVAISGILCKGELLPLHFYLNRLKKFCEAKESIHITCDILNNVFGITKIAIESYDFPFTKGEDYQAFTINALSDEMYQLLEEK
jgi:hypothetical protein